MTDHMHPVFAQIMRNTLHSYGMPTMPPPRTPEEVRRELAQHTAPPMGSADAI